MSSKPGVWIENRLLVVGFRRCASLNTMSLGVALSILANWYLCWNDGLHELIVQSWGLLR
jgi:hypothetical protein